MEELERHGKVGVAALRAGMHRNTASRYRDLGKVPSELREPRSWRTREDPFVEDWPAVAQRLAAAPELEAKVLFGRDRSSQFIPRDPQGRPASRSFAARARRIPS